MARLTGRHAAIHFAGDRKPPAAGKWGDAVNDRAVKHETKRRQVRRSRRADRVTAPGPLIAALSRATDRLMKRLVRLYYPRIEVHGSEHLPASEPVLYVANHANSLIDPVIISIIAGRKVHFLAKAPLFEMPIFGRLMKALGMIPAYRGVDSRAQVKRNLESLDAAAELLSHGFAVGLFPEGKSHDALHVDQVRTGAARIALTAAHSGATELKVVPIGINYELKERFRSAVWVDVGKPLDIADWLAENAMDASTAEAGAAEGEESDGAHDRKLNRLLTDEIARRLKQTVIHLDDTKLEPVLDDVEGLLPGFDELRRSRAGALRLRKQVADAMNHLLASDPDRAQPLVDAIAAHHQRLEAAGLTIKSPVMHLRGFWLFGLLLWKTLRLTFGILPMVAGTVHHLVPFITVRVVSSRFQQPGRMTIALTRLLFGLPVYAGWYALVWWWIAWQFPSTGHWIAWTWCGLMPFAGLFALSYWYRAREAAGLWWHQVRALMQGRQLAELRRERSEIASRLAAMAEAYLQSQQIPATSG
jgi:1-acyl-sn-glycerol-3-phosphate acyltransferase